MGSGKSTIGATLAKKLNLPFFDLDKYIEKAEKKSITTLFESEGQIGFRKKEHLYLNEVLNNEDNFVLATGGGAPCYSGNMKVILEASPNVFYLRVAIPELVSRLVPEKADRPLIAHLSEEEMPEFLGKHLFERSHFYAEAHHTIVCDKKSTDEISSEIESVLV